MTWNATYSTTRTWVRLPSGSWVRDDQVAAVDIVEEAQGAKRCDCRIDVLLQNGARIFAKRDASRERAEEAARNIVHSIATHPQTADQREADDGA